MTDVFLDTVGLIATWDLRDQWHQNADIAYEALARSGRRLVTTPLILWECGNAACRRPYRRRVNVVRQHFMREGLLFEPSADEIERAWLAFDNGEAGQAGIVDHVSFVVMRRLGITEAFTNDSHFEAAGFTTLF